MLLRIRQIGADLLGWIPRSLHEA